MTRMAPLSSLGSFARQQWHALRVLGHLEDVVIPFGYHWVTLDFSTMVLDVGDWIRVQSVEFISA